MWQAFIVGWLLGIGVGIVATLWFGHILIEKGIVEDDEHRSHKV